MTAHAQDMDLFVTGPDTAAPTRSTGCRFASVTEYAWHALFIRNLLIRPEREALPSCPKMTIINLPSFEADPERHGCRSGTVIAVDLKRASC
jgi:phosphoenolpyruvate carboxykinase (ATP)